MRRQKGQYMIEALIGIAVLGILVIFILSLFASRYGFDKHNSIRTDALYLAEQGIERVKSNPAGIPHGVFTTENYQSIPLYPDYKREYSISVYDATMNLYTVTAAVSWRKPGSSQEREMASLTTIVRGE